MASDGGVALIGVTRKMAGQELSCEEVAEGMAELTKKLCSELEAQHKGVLTLVDTLLPLSNFWEVREAIICIEDRG